MDDFNLDIIEPVYDEAEYVSPSRQKIRKLLEEWYREIKQERTGQLSEQKAKDLERESHELNQILNILTKVWINPKVDSTAPEHQDQGIILY